MLIFISVFYDSSLASPISSSKERALTIQILIFYLFLASSLLERGWGEAGMLITNPLTHNLCREQAKRDTATGMYTAAAEIQIFNF